MLARRATELTSAIMSLAEAMAAAALCGARVPSLNFAVEDAMLFCLYGRACAGRAGAGAGAVALFRGSDVVRPFPPPARPHCSLASPVHGLPKFSSRSAVRISCPANSLALHTNTKSSPSYQPSCSGSQSTDCSRIPPSRV